MRLLSRAARRRRAVRTASSFSHDPQGSWVLGTGSARVGAYPCLFKPVPAPFDFKQGLGPIFGCFQWVRGVLNVLH